METTWNRIGLSLEEFAPRLLAAVAILIVGWIVAWLVSKAVKGLLHRTSIDDRIARWMGASDVSGTEAAAGKAAFWTVMLLVLIAALEALAFDAVTRPLNDVVSNILGFLPNLIAALAILLIGYIVARIVRAVVSNFASAMGVDRAGARAGVSPDARTPALSEVVGLIAFALVLIPTIVASLNALNLTEVSRPASNMLDRMLAALPDLFAATVLLVIAYLVARIVQQLATSILSGIGFDTVPARLGAHGQVQVGGARLSEIAGYLLFAAVMLTAAMEAARLVGFGALAVLLQQFLFFASQVILGLIIIAIGFWLANLVAGAIRATQVRRADLLARIGQAAVIFFAISVGLGHMGIAEEIVILAFALPVAAVAIGVAVGLGVAIGLGGRSTAARLLDNATDAADGGVGGVGGGRTPGGTI